MTPAAELLEQQELVQKLVDAGHGQLVEVLLHEAKAYTQRGRLNKSGTKRLLGWTSGQLDAALAKCRELLAPDLEVE